MKRLIFPARCCDLSRDEPSKAVADSRRVLARGFMLGANSVRYDIHEYKSNCIKYLNAISKIIHELCENIVHTFTNCPYFRSFSFAKEGLMPGLCLSIHLPAESISGLKSSCARLGRTFEIISAGTTHTNASATFINI